jgi:hypothetical protein
LVIDLDATLVAAHSEKGRAAPTLKRGFGFHPLCAFIDHGPAAIWEPAALLLRAANTAADHKTILADALAQLPGASRFPVGRTMLIRADAGGGTHEFLDQRLAYSVGFGPSETMAERSPRSPRLRIRLAATSCLELGGITPQLTKQRDCRPLRWSPLLWRRLWAHRTCPSRIRKTRRPGAGPLSGPHSCADYRARGAMKI